MVRKTDRRKVEKFHAIGLLTNARQHQEAMHLALESGLWNPAASNSINCAINACNALTVAIGGVRSSSKSHEDATYLLIEVIEGKDTKEATKFFRRLSRQKTEATYGDDLLRKKDAENAVRDADRFMEWVESRMPPRYM